MLNDHHGIASREYWQFAPILFYLFAFMSFNDFYGFYILDNIKKAKEMNIKNIKSVNNIKKTRIVYNSSRYGNPMNFIFNPNNYYLMDNFYVQLSEEQFRILKSELKNSEYIKIYYERRDTPSIDVFNYVHQIETKNWQLHNDIDKYYYSRIRNKYITILIFMLVTFLLLRHIYYNIFYM